MILSLFISKGSKTNKKKYMREYMEIRLNSFMKNLCYEIHMEQ